MRGVITSNKHLIPINYGKKTRHVRNWKSFKNKRLVTKTTNGPGRVFYHLFKNTPYRCSATSTVRLYRLTHVNFFKNEVETIKGIRYYMKAPSGVNSKHYLPQKKFLRFDKVSHFVGEGVGISLVNTGGLVYSLKIQEHSRWIVAQSAGTFCKLLWTNYEIMYCAINIPSKQFMKVGIWNKACLGRVSNKLQKRYSYMSAMKAKRKKQNILSVRGVAMNPVDHPNGGRSNTKQPLKNPWGRPAKKNK